MTEFTEIRLIKAAKSMIHIYILLIICYVELILSFGMVQFSLIRGWSRVLIWVSVELCEVEGQPEAPPWLVPKGKIWTSRYSKNAFLRSLFLLTVLNQIWKCIAFVTLHSSSPRFISNIGKIILLQSVLSEHRSIFSCENVVNMAVSSTESKILYLLCRRNFKFCTASMSSDSAWTY